MKLKFIFKIAIRALSPVGVANWDPSSCEESLYPVSKKCCKSYKEGKACKKCPRFHDWNYLMSWKPIQPQDGRPGGEWPQVSTPSCETRLREPCRLRQDVLPILEAV